MSVAALAEALRRSQYTVVLTGAGLSTESGIPDFRSDQGVWSRADPMEVGSIEGFRESPQRFYDFWSHFFAGLGTIAPSPMHRLLASLEDRGMVRSIITQNVDGLHQLAGSRRVLEAHGNWQRTRCTSCGHRERWDAVMLETPKGMVPSCAACGGLVRPDVVLFGELLGPVFAECETEARRAELFVAMGTSLEVAPVSGLPRLAREEGAGGGAVVAIVNRDPTAMDRVAHHVVRGELGTIAKELEPLLR